MIGLLRGHGEAHHYALGAVAERTGETQSYAGLQIGRCEWVAPIGFPRRNR